MTITVTEANNGGQLHAQAGDTLDVSLPENATTGYRWELDNLDPHLFELAEADARYPSKALGSGGAAHFVVKIRAAGSTTFRAKYWRSWEGEAGILQRFSLQVEIT